MIVIKNKMMITAMSAILLAGGSLQTEAVLRMNRQTIRKSQQQLITLFRKTRS